MHVITGFQIMAFTAKEKLQLMAIIGAIPTQWRHHLKTYNNYQNTYEWSQYPSRLLKLFRETFTKKSAQRSRFYQPHS